jgi:delta8-fatty-acid desaturase
MLIHPFPPGSIPTGIDRFAESARSERLNWPPMAAMMHSQPSTSEHAERGVPTLGGIPEPGADPGESPGKPQITKDFHALNRRIRDAGLYETRGAFYVGKYLLLAALLAAAWMVAPEVPALAGLLFGLFVQQAAFIGHDLGHDSVMTRDRGLLFNRKFKHAGSWVIGNLCFGVDGLDWSKSHDGHHKVNLLYDHDPQNKHLPWLLYDAGEIDYFCNRGGRITSFNRFWLRHQHLFALPLMLLYGKLNMLLKQRKLYKRGDYVRFLGIVSHLLMWVALFLRADYSAGFCLVALLTCGVIHIQILLSHAYMPRFTEDEQHRIGWIRYQVLGTQNVDTSWYDGWFHGGLQYQIEHHLYAGVPRHNLPKIKPWVMEFCKTHGLPYHSDPFLVCIADMLRSFYRQSRNVEVRV